MAGRAAPSAIDRSGAQGCRRLRRELRLRRCAPAASDRSVPARCARRPAARKRRRPDRENFGGEVSFRTSLSLHITRSPRRRGRLWPLCVRARRQAYRKHRALARLARHRYVTAHHARQLAGDGEPEPSAAETLRGRGISLAELLEQLRLLLRGHADAAVLDRKLDPAASVGDPARSQGDLTFLGKLAGIAEEIEQYLPQPHGVDGQCAEVLLGVNDEAVLVLLGKLSG